jgi:hypothetical protein
MIESYDEFNKSKFLEAFKRKFNNVLKKAPIKAKVNVYEPTVLIEVEGFDQNPIQYTFDYSISPKTDLALKKNIYNLRNLLKELTFPIIEVESEETLDYTQEEIEKLIHEENYSVDEALGAKKVIKKTKNYKIERVIIDRDEIFIEDLETNERKRYRLIGVSFFLFNLRNGKFNKKTAGSYFFEKAKFLNDILPEKEWIKTRHQNNNKTEYVTIR